MEQLKLFASAILAGVCIGLGGAAFVAQSNRLLGACLFCIGLLTICQYGFALFTGRACYALQQDAAYALKLPLIWLGNLVGTGLTALLLSQTRVVIASRSAAQALVYAKSQDSLLSLFILGVFCNIFVFLAVEGYRSAPHVPGKYLAVFLGVIVFVLSGYEHSIADMFYFFMAGRMNGDALLRILVISAGNAAGGLCACNSFRLVQNRAKS